LLVLASSPVRIVVSILSKNAIIRHAAKVQQFLVESQKMGIAPQQEGKSFN